MFQVNGLAVENTLNIYKGQQPCFLSAIISDDELFTDGVHGSTSQIKPTNDAEYLVTEGGDVVYSPTNTSDLSNNVYYRGEVRYTFTIANELFNRLEEREIVSGSSEPFPYYY